ncbi:MAG TPA: hypothetical protein EYN66_17160 [Myxococcales bacterium]|nr:hypothetical protein [Myxococcales bacterium]
MRSIIIIILVLGVACESAPVQTTATTETTTTTTDTALAPVVVWDDLGIVSSVMFNALYATSNEAWVGDANGSLWRVEPSGNTVEVASVDSVINGLWGTGEGEGVHVVAVGESGLILDFTNQEISLEDLGAANLYDVAGVGTDLFTVGWGGAFVDSGNESLPSGVQLNALYAGDTVIFGVGQQGAIVARSADGVWLNQFSPTIYDIRAISGNADDNIWAVGDFGLVLHYDGISWETLDSDLLVTLWGVWVAPTSEVFFVGNNGYAGLYTGEGGIQEVYTGVNANLYAVDGLSAGVVWAVGSQGQILKFNSTR